MRKGAVHGPTVRAIHTFLAQRVIASPKKDFDFVVKIPYLEWRSLELGIIPGQPSKQQEKEDSSAVQSQIH